MSNKGCHDSGDMGQRFSAILCFIHREPLFYETCIELPGDEVVGLHNFLVEGDVCSQP